MQSKSQIGENKIKINTKENTFTAPIQLLYEWRITQIKLDSSDSKTNLIKLKYNILEQELLKSKEMNVKSLMLAPVYENKIKNLQIESDKQVVYLKEKIAIKNKIIIIASLPFFVFLLVK